MYDVKELINRMKTVANINSNVKLAEILNVSYNTFNTWLKRHKLPQDVLYNFCIKYKCSLDYLIFNKNDSYSLLNFQKTAETASNTDDSFSNYLFYGTYEPLNIKPGQNLKLNSTLLHSGAYYLIKVNSTCFIAKVDINPFENIAYIRANHFSKELPLKEFINIKLGLILI